MILPREYIVFDTEYTSWEGSQERGWSLPGEYREIIQIGAIKISALEERDHFSVFVRPTKNPELSEFITKLTGITQQQIDLEGLSFNDAQELFFSWCGGLPLFSYGGDEELLKENCVLNDIPYRFGRTQFADLCMYFKSLGIDTNVYMSSTMPEAFGVASPYKKHDGLSDARSLLLALKFAIAKS